MKQIVLFGAGKSSSYCIKYLIQNAKEHNWKIKVVDINTLNAKNLFGNYTNIEFLDASVEDNIIRKKIIMDAHIVLSLLPPSLHILVAKDCLEYRKNLITASYVSEEIKAMNESVNEAGILFMCEMGLDPGIDHMSTMKVLNDINRVGGNVETYISCCGGLVAPESDNNPWHYKISWNPRNVVLAGKSGAKYKADNEVRTLEYDSIFSNYQITNIPSLGNLAYYANRDSVSYESLYGLDGVKTLLRATFRYPSFMTGWKKIIDLNLTDEKDSYDTTNKSIADWVAQKNKIEASSLKDFMINGLSQSDAIDIVLLFTKLQFFDGTHLNIGRKSSADILQHIIEKNLKMETHDKDMIVMHHYFEYIKKNIKTQLYSTCIVKGEDSTYTAMAKTVGLPMAILAKLILTDKIKNLTGVQIPTDKRIYEPVLKELKENGIDFEEIAY